MHGAQSYIRNVDAKLVSISGPGFNLKLKVKPQKSLVKGMMEENPHGARLDAVIGAPAGHDL
eukprot:1160749-Pelagomonas_calceolata.AAC.8